MIGGDVIYGRPDWVDQLTARRLRTGRAWGRQMVLDTRFGSPDDASPTGHRDGSPTCVAKLIGRYPAVGPIFA